MCISHSKFSKRDRKSKIDLSQRRFVTAENITFHLFTPSNRFFSAWEKYMLSAQSALKNGDLIRCVLIPKDVSSISENDTMSAILDMENLHGGSDVHLPLSISSSSSSSCGVIFQSPLPVHVSSLR